MASDASGLAYSDEHTPPHRQGEHDAWANDEELMLQL